MGSVIIGASVLFLALVIYAINKVYDKYKIINEDKEKEKENYEKTI